MEISLDIEAKKLFGKTTLYWKNTSEDTIKELQFHLYYNAFKNTKSTFFKERGFPSFLSNGQEADCNWGFTEIRSMKDESGNDLTNSISYIQPDDDNEDDQTVISVSLENSIKPLGQRTIEFTWQAKIPKTMPRTGYNKEYYFFAQWFPKIGVYEAAGVRYAEEGKWNCHQYHSIGEYYADFGLYNVALTVPDNYIVGASGELIEKQETDTGTKWTFRAEDVIDFTWTCSPHYVVTKDKWKDVEISLLSYPDHLHFKDRYIKTIKNAMSYLDEHVGKYPYTTLTIVDPPIHGLFTGGMEYPTIISSLSFNFFPSGFKTIETLTTHEFIHQYFMQMLASQEQEEPWMDEGITTYYEGRILDHYEGKHRSTIDWLGITIGNKAYNRAEFLSSGNTKIADNNYKARDYKHGGYKAIAYNKTAIVLETLEGIIGTTSMDKMMQLYFETWKFKHPSGQDLINLATSYLDTIPNKPLRMKAADFFDQTLFGTGECDFILNSIENTKAENAAGYLNSIDDCVPLENIDTSSEITYNSKIIVRQDGQVNLPVDIKIEFENGEEKFVYWDGQSRSTEFTFLGAHKITSAIIDPDKKITLDKNFLNNSRSISENNSARKKYGYKIISGLQHLIENCMLLF
jgi:hypothetical protein